MKNLHAVMGAMSGFQSPPIGSSPLGDSEAALADGRAQATASRAHRVEALQASPVMRRGGARDGRHSAAIVENQSAQ